MKPNFNSPIFAAQRAFRAAFFCNFLISFLVLLPYLTKQIIKQNVVLLLVMYLFPLCLAAQTGGVGIGTNTPNSNASLDLAAVNKGILLNRVTLAAANNPAPLTAHVAGMLVYNTATAGTSPDNVSPGIYFNDGSRWVRYVPTPQGLFVRSAGTQLISGSSTIADWSMVKNDFGGAWNGSVFTVPAGMQGWYTVSTAFQTDADGSTARTPFQHVYIMVNGSTVALATGQVHVSGGTVNSNAPGSGTAVASITYYLNAGDQVSVIGHHLSYTVPGNVSTSLHPGSLHTYLSIFKQ